MSNLLDLPKVLLGSKSPRRSELLRQAGVNFRVEVNNVVEDYPAGLQTHEVSLYLARLKAEACIDLLQEKEVLVTADTLVCLEDEILGKPNDPEAATYMLTKLSGKVHEVITGVCVRDECKEDVFYAKTEVHFKELQPSEILYYVTQFKPFDKAGAYAIQEWIGIIGIDKIVGDYYNVVGLPVADLVEVLKSF
ncbi:MAG: septum formation protein Maf [Bacteroidetes bacterium]|nr:septum formation protein Maf [Bacteroidota bacterium]